MKNIEIITTQNVVLQYELASLRDRIMAFVLDVVVMVIAFSILANFLSAIFSATEVGSTAAVLLVTCLVCVYSLMFEFLNKGRSIGKMALKIQVITLTGGNAALSDYAARWAFRLVDIYFSLGGIALILIVSSTKAQRLGDIIGNTAVVKTVPKTQIDLEDLLVIHKSDGYTPTYHQAKKLHEQDALLIKATLERHRKFYNDAHHEALDLLYDRIKAVLDIDHHGSDRKVFLHTILKDYVVLSRQ